MPPKRRYNRKYKPKKKAKQANAYKPKNKRRMQMRRQPFVETKRKVNLQLDSTVVNPLTNATNPLLRTWSNVQISPIQTFMFQKRGHNDGEMVGRDLYSKYLRQKIEITLPEGKLADTSIPIGNVNRPYGRITRPCQIWVVWGWIKRPYGSRDDPNGNPADANDILAEINRITHSGMALMGNPDTRDTHDTDYTTFTERRPKLWTMNKRLLRSRNAPVSVKVAEGDITQYVYETDGNGQPREDTGRPANYMQDFGDVLSNTGFPNRLQTTIDWKTSRKVSYKFEDASNTTEGFAQDSWMPYSYIVIPKEYQEAVKTSTNAVYSYESAPGSGLFSVYKDLVNDMKVNCSECHWFTDS